MEKAKVHQLEKCRSGEDIDRQRPSYLEIDLDALSENFRLIKEFAGPDVSVMAVVKANAYGHGIIEVARHVREAGADFLGVAFIEEGEKLLSAGIEAPIVVLYPDLPERASRHVRAGLMATVDSIEYLEALNEASRDIDVRTSVFIKVETGMGRYGIDDDKASYLVTAAREMPYINFIGLTTNLADSSNGDTSFTESQFSHFKRTCELCNLGKDKIRSIENSSGLLFHHDNNCSLIRVGLLLYGCSPRNLPGMDFKPVMSLKSRILKIKPWPKGKPVGYGGKFIPDRDIVLATVGVGYADGYPWSLSNKADVLINGKRAPVVGRVCMDALMVDISSVKDLKEGDEVVLMGKSGNEEITADELGELAGSFSYEILAGMSERLPRIYRRG